MPATLGSDSGFAGDARCHTVQKGSQRLRSAQRLGFPHQDQKRGLESVFGVLIVVEQSAAHAPHQRRMTMHQRLKRCFIAAGVSAKQLAIGRVGVGDLVELA
jgi:hypothetical protein